MKRFGSGIRLVLLVVAPFALYQFFFYFARKPLNEALIEAVNKNDLSQTVSLLNRGADVNTREIRSFASCTDQSPPASLRTPLISSTFRFKEGTLFRHDLKMMKLLLQRGADPNLQDAEKKTALISAAGQGQMEAVQLLVSYGADVNIERDGGFTALAEAAMRGHRDIVKLLLAQGANVNAKTPFASSALSGAAGNNDIETMNLLLKRGAIVNSRDQLGYTPLHRAVEVGAVKAIGLLLQHGADPNIRHNYNETPLMHLSTYDLRFTSDPNRAQVAARRALMVKLLQQAGATR